MATTLTKRQKEILDYVTQYIESKGYAPSYREIAEFFGLSSVATVSEHIHALEEKGLLEKGDNEARSLSLVDALHKEIQSNSDDPVELPILGVIRAGYPMETYAHAEETLEVPPFMIGRKKSYVLQVKGQSMIEDGIQEGDYVVVEENYTPHNGQMVIAMINGSESTLKRYYKEKDHIRLQPANSGMEPIIVPKETPIDIQGVVVGVIRKF
jgi:repressor LexA